MQTPTAEHHQQQRPPRGLRSLKTLAYTLVLALLASCAAPHTPTTADPASWKRYKQEGKASYYANSFQGKKMANGQPYRKGKMTAAHKHIPFGTKVRVTDTRTNKSVKVTITDRGPFVAGRIVDLSLKAARRLDMVGAGVVPVKLKVIRTAPGTGKGSVAQRR